MHQYLLVFPLLCTFCWSCNNISSPEDDPNKDYPTTLHFLAQTELDSLKTIFNQKLGSTYLATLDSFGLIGHKMLRRGTSTISEAGQAISLAKTAVVYLKDFSNVTDTSMLYVKGAHHITSPFVNDWDITFEKQRINNIEVMEPEIRVIVADNFILLTGHFYRDIFVPTQNLITKMEAKKILVGTQIHYDCWVPSTFMITDSTINTDSLKLSIFPLLKNRDLELRTAWKVPVSYNLDGYPMWFYFIDVITGEIIGFEQVFIC